MSIKQASRKTSVRQHDFLKDHGCFWYEYALEKNQRWFDLFSSTCIYSHSILQSEDHAHYWVISLCATMVLYYAKLSRHATLSIVQKSEH